MQWKKVSLPCHLPRHKFSSSQTQLSQLVKQLQSFTAIDFHFYLILKFGFNWHERRMYIQQKRLVLGKIQQMIGSIHWLPQQYKLKFRMRKNIFPLNRYKSFLSQFIYNFLRLNSSSVCILMEDLPENQLSNARIYGW